MSVVNDDQSLDGSPGSDLDRASIQSIDRAANVLALLDQHTPTLSAGMVAERLGMNRTTAHRYLQSLHRAGFLGASFGPGPLLDQLSSLVSTRQQVLTFAPPIMRQLSDSTGLTVVLSFMGRSGAVVTLVEEASRGTVVLTVKLGTVLEVKAAQTRVLLAFKADPSAVTRAHSTLSPADAAREQATLVSVRRHKHAWADLHRVGIASVAVPVFARDEVPAAMALIGTTAMLSPADRTAANVRALERAAEALSAMISG